MDDRVPLILASASPRRLDLLARLGVVPDRIVPADIDETPVRGERPRHYALRMADEKARAVAMAGIVTLAADTVVATGARILPKAEDEAVARDCLNRLAGRRHHVLTAVTIVGPDGYVRHRLSDSIVTFAPLSSRAIDAYLASGEWRGKAGGYAIQGRAEAFVRALSGSHSGVVGLPLYETRGLLIAAGVIDG